MTSLSGCDMYLEADAKILTVSLKHLACFIQKCPLKGRPIEQFPSVLGIGSYVWRLFQAVSEAGWDRFKISPQPDAPTLVEAMRTVYGSVPVPTPSPNVEMAVNAPEAEEVAFTLVTNQKRKGKGKVPSPLSGSPLTLGARHRLSQGLPLSPRLWPLTQSQQPLRPSKPRWRHPLFPWPPSLSPRPSHLLRLSKPMSPSRLQGLLLPHLIRTFCACCSLRKHFPTFLRLPSFPCTRPA